MEKLETERYKSFIGIIAYVSAFYVLGAIITMVMAKVIGNHFGYTYSELVEASNSYPSLDGSLNKAACYLTCYSNLLSYVLGVIAVGVVMFGFLKTDFADLKKRFKKLIVYAIIVGIIFALISEGLDLLSSHICKTSSDNQNIIVGILEIKPLVPVMLISTVIIAPILEELVFRKAIFKLFSNKPDYIPIIVSSVVFALIHMLSTSLGINWIILFICYYICALLLTLIYKFSGKNIYVSIFAHMLNNLFACLIILLL